RPSKAQERRRLPVDLSHPASAIVPSLEGPVLTVLGRTSRPLTGRDVHRLADTGSESGVRRVLTRLDQHSVVNSMQAGHETLSAANRDHLAWPAVVSVTEIRSTFFRRLRELTATWSPAPTTVAVFGSMARGDGGVASDIDVLVIGASGTDTDPWRAQVDELRSRIKTWTGNEAQIYELTEPELRNHVTAGEAIVTEWRRDAVTIIGSPLTHLLQEVVR